jgi:hypothetical protein
MKYCSPAFEQFGYFCFIGSKKECDNPDFDDGGFWTHMKIHTDDELELLGLRKQELSGLSSRENRIGQSPNCKRGEYKKKTDGSSL